MLMSLQPQYLVKAEESRKDLAGDMVKRVPIQGHLQVGDSQLSLLVAIHFLVL